MKTSKLKSTVTQRKSSAKISSVKDHEFFGFLRNDTISVEQEINNLRAGRHRDI